MKHPTPNVWEASSEDDKKWSPLQIWMGLLLASVTVITLALYIP
jgi:hypothetical protein